MNIGILRSAYARKQASVEYDHSFTVTNTEEPKFNSYPKQVLDVWDRFVQFVINQNSKRGYVTFVRGFCFQCLKEPTNHRRVGI